MKRTDRRGEQGMSLLEMMVILVVMGIAAAFFAPLVHNLILRSKLEGAARDTAALMQRARLEAVKRAAPAIVRIDEASGRFQAFVDIDGTTAGSPPDGLFNPVAGQALGRTDFEIGVSALPPHVILDAPGTDPAVDALTTIAGEKVARFLANGSIETIGAVRLADPRQNFLEVRIEPQATARVSVRKWDGTAWFGRGEGEPWTWN